MRRRITLLLDPERRAEAFREPAPAAGATPRTLESAPIAFRARPWQEAEALERACRAYGHVVTRAELPADPGELVAVLREARPDIVLPLVARERAVHVASVLEWCAIARAGARSAGLVLTRERALAHSLLRARGVPVPRAFALESPDDPLPDLGLGKRWRVRPARVFDGESEELVDDPATLRALVQRTRERALFVDEHVEGREYRVCILGAGVRTRVLSPASRASADTASGALAPRAALADEHLPLDTDELLRAIALAAHEALELSGFVRIDLRMSADRGPLVADVHPDCDLSPNGELARAAARDGLGYEALVDRILADAIAELAPRSRSRTPRLA